jgi:hypothetical protein
MPDGPEFDPQADLIGKKWKIRDDEAAIGIYHIDTEDGAHQVGEIYGLENAEAVISLPEYHRLLERAFRLLGEWRHAQAEGLTIDSWAILERTCNQLREEVGPMLNRKKREEIVDRGNGYGED